MRNCKIMCIETIIKGTQIQMYRSNLCVAGSPLCSRCWNWTADECEAAAAELDSSHMSLVLSGAAQQPARWRQHAQLAAKHTQTQLLTQTLTCSDTHEKWWHAEETQYSWLHVWYENAPFKKQRKACYQVTIKPCDTHNSVPINR